VVPIKLDSLWTPHTAQQANSTSPYAGFSPINAAGDQATAAGTTQQSGLSPDNSGIDLASMFISTPADAAAAAAAAAAGSSSPIAGLLAGETPAAAAPAAATSTKKQQQMETPSAYDNVLMGSPALPGTFAFAGAPLWFGCSAHWLWWFDACLQSMECLANAFSGFRLDGVHGDVHQKLTPCV
jgi:hypothetical protein